MLGSLIQPNRKEIEELLLTLESKKYS